MQPIISFGKGQCFPGAKEVPRAKPKALPRLHKSTDLPWDITGLTSLALGRDILYIVPSYTVLALRNPQQCGVYEL